MIKVRYVIAVAALTSALGLNLAALAARAQATPNHAGLIIQGPNGQVTTRCVAFDEPEITGYELLRRSNLPLVVDIASGGSLCKIQNTGCNFPAQKCFCECQDLNQSCIYWQYFFLSGGTWKYSPLGMLGQKVTNGSVNGWSYGVGSASSGGAAPPLMTVEQICEASAAPTAPPTAAPAATKQQVAPPASTANLIPASTPTPTAATVTAVSTTALAVTPSPVAFSSPSPASATSPTVPSTKTPVSVAAAEPATATSQPSLTPRAALIPTIEPATTTQPDASSTTSYVVFGVIVVALVGLLLVTRSGMGKSKQ